MQDVTSQKTQPNSQKVVVKDTMYVHAIHSHQTRINLAEYCAICTLDVMLFNGHVTNCKASTEGAPLTMFNCHVCPSTWYLVLCEVIDASRSRSDVIQLPVKDM